MKLTKYSRLIPMVALVFGASGSQRLSAQAARPAPPVRLGTPATQKAKSNTPKQQPCWQEAGISKAAIDERRSIQESKRAQVEAICDQPGLTDKEKREKIREIREAAQQKIATLIPAEQQEKLTACQRARAQNAGPHPGGARPSGGGPCAQFGH